MRRTGLLAEFFDRTTFTDDEVATQNLADREEDWPVCVHGARHVRCYHCIDVEVMHVRMARRRADRHACLVASELMGNTRAVYDKSRRAARRILRQGRRRCTVPICLHRQRRNECLICIGITALHLRAKWRKDAKRVSA